MFRIILGNLGAGKSLFCVREMAEDTSGFTTYTNIITKNIKNVIHVKPENVISKTYDEKEKVKFELNMDFWMSQKKPLNVIWDEIHLSMGNSRQSLSRANMVLSRFVAMGRRITGMSSGGIYGMFTFCAQSERTVDVNIRELTTDILYLVSHWMIFCDNCKYSLYSNSEQPVIRKCQSCGSWDIFKYNLQIECRKFRTWDNYFNFRANVKGHWHYERIMINDVIEKYSKFYDTLQYKDIWSDYISE